ncbi:MAG: HEAT repeat domain-containing protein, partial [Planctomycetota bacterium]|nr:HEAT repeat domain-containing protein [Planctomycetota bacterium]
EAYLHMISSSDASSISAAARYLAYLDSERGRARILALVKDHGTPAVRHNTYTNGARNLRGGPPLAVMRAASKDGYGPLQAEAVRDLAKIGHGDAPKRALELAALRPVHITVGQAVAEVLGALGNGKAVAAMLGLLDDPKLHANVRKKILEQLRFLRAPDAVAAMVKGLKSKVPAIRSTSADVLAGILEPGVTKALLARAKKEKDPEVLAQLLEALGDHGDPVAMPVLLKQAKKRKKGAARASAVRGLARLGFHHPKIRAFLLALLASKDADSRILALDAAGASGDPTVVPKVLPNLAHEAWQVRLTAVEALDALRPRAAIAPLIERLQIEEAERVRDAIAHALFRLTGMNLYDDGAIWARWWSQNEKGFEVPADIPTLPEQHVGGTQAGFYGIPVKSERIVFVIDQSGSMSAAGMRRDEDDASTKSSNRLDLAVREVLGAIAKLKNRARVNVILFHTTIHPWKPTMQRLSSGNRAALERHLTSKKPTGGTNLYDGLEMALLTKDVDTVFLLSDGAPGSGKYVATPDILRAVRRENQTRRIAIHCVSIGMDSELMKRLARENGGRYARR